MRFSERFGYVKPVEVLKRGGLDEEGATALCNCYDYLAKWLNQFDVENGNRYDESYTDMDEAIWCFFLNRRRDDFYEFHGHKVVATEYLLDDHHEWFKNFDMIEYSIRVLRSMYRRSNDFCEIVERFIRMINNTFNRLDYAYRVVDDQIVEIADQEEIATIEEAVKQTSSINTHLSAALKHLSSRPSPDYRNSIKESISAVEALCREITGATTLGGALKELEKNGLVIPTFLKNGFEKLYVYTNDERTGIRHAQMSDSETPGFDEAKFMLVACSAFVNYIQGKRVG